MVGISHNPGDSELFACQPQLVGLLETLINVIFCAKDRDGVYVEVNSAFVRRTGKRAKGEVIGTRAGDHFNPELAQRYEEQDARVFATCEPLYDELELIRRPSGELGWYLTTKLPVVDPATSEALGVVNISRDLIAPEASSETFTSLQEVVRHVQEHYATQLRVDDLAGIAGCSGPQLERRMKKVFGVTMTQHVLRVRVEAATRLLAETDVPIAQVATRCGFYDQPDFTRRFARLTNSTPAEFRAGAELA